MKKTGEEIHGILAQLEPAADPQRFLACPLHRAGAGCLGNPDASLAAHLLKWPMWICSVIAEAFDSDGRWPENLEKRMALYGKRFALSVLAGRRECMEADNPGSTF